MRIDLLLKYLCLVKTRSMGKKGCEKGRIKINGLAVKPAGECRAGDVLEIRYPHRILVAELLEEPGGQVSRKESAKYLRIIREINLDREEGGWDA